MGSGEFHFVADPLAVKVEPQNVGRHLESVKEIETYKMEIEIKLIPR